MKLKIITFDTHIKTSLLMKRNLLLLIFIITIIVQVCNGSGVGSAKPSVSPTQFGRFSF